MLMMKALTHTALCSQGVMRRFFWQYSAMEGMVAIAMVVSRTFIWMRALLLSALISGADAVTDDPAVIVSETNRELNFI